MEKWIGRKGSARPSAVWQPTGAQVALLRSLVLQPAIASSLEELLTVKRYLRAPAGGIHALNFGVWGRAPTRPAH